MTAPARTLHAPAKLNLTLEVLGRRADGYHEIRSVVTPITIFDELRIDDQAAGFIVNAAESYDAAAMPDWITSLNTVETAVALVTARRLNLPSSTRSELETALRRGLEDVSIRLTKRIPSAAGLGGGSSDAAVALVGLSAFWSMGLSLTELDQLALRIGSDCPLFLRDGTLLMGGRGEQLQPLPAPSRFWGCLIDPHILRPQKTAMAYGLLHAEHFDSGDASQKLAAKLIGSGRYRLQPGDLRNTFEGVMHAAYGDLTVHRHALSDAGAVAVQLCGAGPALWGLFLRRRALPKMAADRLNADGFTALPFAGLSGETTPAPLVQCASGIGLRREKDDRNDR